MKPIRLSPWLVLVLAVVLIAAVGCDRPDPQVQLATPVPGPQEVVQPETLETPVPGDDTTAPLGATPTLPAVIVATLEAEPATEPTPELVPTADRQTQPTPQPTPQPNPSTHTVKPGETLFSIGRLYNVNPYAIAAANNIPYPYIIYPGQQLIIPTSGTTPPGPTPPPQPGTCRYYHTVRPGENLYRISLAYGVPMATIAAANGIVNYNLIYAGQTLCIP